MEYDNLEETVAFLMQAEKKVDEKIAALQYSKLKIQLAKADYERKLQEREKLNGTVLKDYPERVILLSDTLEMPTLENLWNYLSHFYEKVTPALKEQFSFEDLAGIYRKRNSKALCCLYSLCGYRRIKGIAQREVPLCKLHQRK